jgi:hypothetical protein
MRLAERLAIGVATAAAVVLFAAARYLPEYHGQLDMDFPRMTPAQSAWVLLAPVSIVVALVLGRRMSSQRMRTGTTVAVAVAAVGALATFLVQFYSGA